MGYTNILQVIGFDGSTTVSEFLSELNRQLGTRGVEHSGFTIHSDDPIDKDLDHALVMEDKVILSYDSKMTILIYLHFTISIIKFQSNIQILNL